jgi:hypothetical protein
VAAAIVAIAGLAAQQPPHEESVPAKANEAVARREARRSDVFIVR